MIELQKTSLRVPFRSHLSKFLKPVYFAFLAPVVLLITFLCLGNPFPKFRTQEEIYQVRVNSRPGLGTKLDSSRTHLDEVLNRTLGFQKIYIISLPERTDRRDELTLGAALTGFDMNIVDAVRGSTVPDKAIPSPPEDARQSDAAIGCWRSHMNVMQDIIRNNITTALILEDDADWDVRIKQQLRDFALSTNSLLQPLQNASNTYADPTYPHPSPNSPSENYDISFSNLPITIPPKTSPYGDNWDLLWLGHCGMTFPHFPKTPKGRIIQSMDPTVPEKQHLKNMISGNDLQESSFPHHTRLVHHASDGLCMLSYAVSQTGARKVLYELGTKDVNSPVDLLLQLWCDGQEWFGKPANCLTTQPAIFEPWRGQGKVGKDTDIAGFKDSKVVREKGFTDVVRWSTRANLGVLIEGGTNFTDQWPDTVSTPYARDLGEER